MNFINSIPVSFGWAIVGFLSAMVVVAACALGKTIIEMRREACEEARSN